MKPHKHSELIKAWADGADIEIRRNEHWDWIHTHKPDWSEAYEYRIQPEPKPERVKKQMHIYYSKLEAKMWFDENPPEKFIYRDLYTYIGEIQVLR